ncbi:MAG: class I SAM-dependent methyltransferase [Coriobacteriia bacterium]|nr:class I SAM-dependent methyltransferase [Coriobacteriia bacterium]
MTACEHDHSEGNRRAPQVDYDVFVNWDARLTREAPFFRRIFDEVGATRVIDVGAGSARHSLMFASWGLTVDSVDPDDSMLEQAERNIADAAERVAESGGAVRLTRGGFGELATLGLAGADALICTGNALPHVRDHAGLREAFADFAAVVRPGGAVVLHLLNHARLLGAKPHAIPPVVRETEEGTLVFLRVLDYPADRDVIGFDFLTLTRDPAGTWDLASRRSEHVALPAQLLQRELEAAGFERVELLGGHDGHALSDADESVIVVARRAAGV